MNEKYELYYYNGGHCGPYQDLASAELAAQRHLKGCKSERAVEVRPRSSPVLGGYSEKNPGSKYYRS